MNTEQLKKLFHQDMIELYKKIIKIVKYKPTRLMDYINRYGGYEAAVKYISTESNVQDFAVLWEKEHLDLSVEALITKEEYRSLFSEEILDFCDRKLKQYSYAPNKIEEVKEPTGYVDEEDEKIDLAELLKQKDLYLPKIKKKEYPIYQKSVGISVEDWKSVLLNEKTVTANNLDLLLRVYGIGDGVGPNDLAAEEGYSSTYPYKEVVTALAKRVKAELKVEVPVGEDKKPIWWHLLFNGGLKDNSAFEWSLKKDLRTALKELIEAGKIEAVQTQSQKGVQNIEEEQVLPKEEPAKKENKKLSNGDDLDAFDRLFASIMGESLVPKQEEKSEAEVQKVNCEEVNKQNVIEEEVAPVIKQDLPVQQEQVVSVENSILNQKDENRKEEPMLTPQEESSINGDKPEDYKTRLKRECLEYYGAICDICGFDFGYTYGEAYEQCIEVHNIHQDGEEISEQTNAVQDLIPICCNCHHVIHSQTPPIPVEKMRKMVKA